MASVKQNFIYTRDSVHNCLQTLSYAYNQNFKRFSVSLELMAGQDPNHLITIPVVFVGFISGFLIGYNLLGNKEISNSAFVAKN